MMESCSKPERMLYSYNVDNPSSLIILLFEYIIFLKIKLLLIMILLKFIFCEFRFILIVNSGMDEIFVQSATGHPISIKWLVIHMFNQFISFCIENLFPYRFIMIDHVVMGRFECKN